MSRETRAAQVPTRLAGSSLEACAPRAKSQLPRLADAPLSPDTPQSAPAKGQDPIRQPGQQRAEHHLRQREREVRDATDHHERRASQGCRCVTSLNTRDGPVFPRPRALPRAFRAKRLGSRATRLGKHARPTTLSPTPSSRLPVPAPTSRARPEPASRPRPHPSFRTRVVAEKKTNENRVTETKTDTQATATASRRRPLPPTRMRRRGRSPTPPACRRTRTPSSTWGARRWAPADSTRRSPGSTTRPRKPSPRR